VAARCDEAVTAFESAGAMDQVRAPIPYNCCGGQESG
jgi:hypothetical protein